MKKRMTILSMVLVLVLGFAGCGKKTAEAPADAAAPAEEAVQETAEETSGSYLVLVTDEENAPIPGTSIQFCSDTTCIMGETDETGIAAFDQEPGHYTVHILKAPEGYAADDTEYEAPAEPGLVTIVLAKADEQAGEPETEAAAETDENVLDIPKMGFRFDTPDKYAHAKGFINWNGYVMAEGVQLLYADYYAVSPDQIEAYSDFREKKDEAVMNGLELPEAPDPSWGTGREFTPLYEVFTINGNRGKEELLAVLEEKMEVTEAAYNDFEEIGSDGDNTFFLARRNDFTENKSEYQEVMGDFFAECEDLYEDKDTFLSALTLSAPEWKRTLAAGDVIFYESSDLDLNPLRSKAIFSEAKVTMVNLWATWCGPCKRELPELAKMAKEFEEQDCQLIGVVLDCNNEEKAALAKELLAEAGVDYINLWAEDNIDEVFPVAGYPTTIFVDREGKILIDPIVGAAVNKYRDAMAEALELAGE